jgi:hypothetical protein
MILHTVYVWHVVVVWTTYVPHSLQYLVHALVHQGLRSLFCEVLPQKLGVIQEVAALSFLAGKAGSCSSWYKVWSVSCCHTVSPRNFLLGSVGGHGWLCFGLAPLDRGMYRFWVKGF